MSKRSQLHKLIRARRWDDVAARLDRHPDEAAFRDGTGTNALHLACGRDPPPPVVDALLRAHPAATSQQDSVGSTPLTVACLSEASSVGVVRALLAHDPASAGRRDAWGGSVLDAVYGGARFAAARERILRGGGGGGGGKTDPAESATTAAAIPAAAGEVAGAADAAADDPAADPPVVDDDDFRDGWEKLCLILRADYHGSVSEPLPGGRRWRAVHACAGATHAPCLPGLLRLAVQLHPEQLGEVDEGGRLPLHVLLSKPRVCGSGGGGGEVHARAAGEMIDFLVLRHPAACGVPDVMSGRPPLATAVDRGGPSRWAGGVESIFRAAPYAVRVRDVDTGLFPFMLAAVGEGCCVDAVFSLLRAFPELKAFPRESKS